MAESKPSNPPPLTTTTRQPLRIAIVGAGLGGLLLATILAHRKHTILLYDSRPSPPTAGSGIMLRPNASRVIARWSEVLDIDLAAAFAAVSDTSPTTAFYNLRTGAAGEKRQAVDVSAWPDWGLGRGEAWGILHRAAQEAGVSVRWGRRVDGFMVRGDKVRVRVHGGRMEDVDLCFDASGAHSALRASILGYGKGEEGPRLRVERGTAYSVSVPRGEVERHETARALLKETTLKVWMGGQGSYVVQRYHERAGDVNLLVFVAEDDATDMKGFWDEDGDIEHLRRTFKGKMAEPLYACLEMATSCSRWKFSEMPDLPRWVGRSGRVAVLGDSAHSMIPNAAQGFTQIIEDIGVLDYLLHEQRPGLELGEVLQLWQEVRIPRVDKVKAFARWNTDIFVGTAPPGEWRKGDGEPGKAKTVQVSLKNTLPDREAKYSSAKFLKWVMDYDALEEARWHVEANHEGKGKARL